MPASNSQQEAEQPASSSTSSAPIIIPVVLATPVKANMLTFVQEALRAIRQVEATEKAEALAKASGGDAAPAQTKRGP